MKSYIIIAISMSIAQLTSAVTLEDVYRDTIINDVTLSVPSEYADIEEALLFLDDKRIAKDATVTIQVADGTYSDCPTIVLDNPYGSRIKIIGNTSSPGSVVLNFVAKDAVYADNGNTIGMIDGFTFVGDNTDYCNGVHAYSNASVTLGQNMIIQEFWCGIITRWNATVYAEGITVQNCSETGINCADSTIIVNDALVEGSTNWGLHCFRTGFIQADNATIRNNTMGQIYIGTLSLIQAENATIGGSPVIDSLGALLQ